MAMKFEAIRHGRRRQRPWLAAIIGEAMRLIIASCSGAGAFGRCSVSMLHYNGAIAPASQAATIIVA